jgi:AcrR family transcriptional regulator
MAVSSARREAGQEHARRPYAARMPAEERREQLLDAALRTAVDQGFAAVTMERVARAAGVTRPVVYGLFPDRGALLAALLERETKRARAALGPALPPVPDPSDDVDPTELLVTGLGAYLRAASEAPDTWRLVLFPVEGAPPELQAAVATSREEALEQVRRLLAWGVAAGGPGGGRRATGAPDVELFARMLVGLAEGAARMVLDEPEVWTVDRFTTFTHQMLEALATEAR